MKGQSQRTTEVNSSAASDMNKRQGGATPDPRLVLGVLVVARSHAQQRRGRQVSFQRAVQHFVARVGGVLHAIGAGIGHDGAPTQRPCRGCLLYTPDAADE